MTQAKLKVSKASVPLLKFELDIYSTLCKIMLGIKSADCKSTAAQPSVDANSFDLPRKLF